MPEFKLGDTVAIDEHADFDDLSGSDIELYAQTRGLRGVITGIQEETDMPYRVDFGRPIGGNNRFWFKESELVQVTMNEAELLFT